MRSTLLILALATASCGGNPPPIADVTPPTPTASATASSDAPPATAPILGDPDPRTVRCGVDDRPRSVGSRSVDDWMSPERNAKRAPMAADVAAPPQMPFPVPAGSVVAPMPVMLRTTVTLSHPRAASAALPTDVATAISNSAPPYADCDGLAHESDEGSIDVRVSYATGGSVLSTTLTTQGEVSPYTRCLLERTCQARGGTSASALDATVTLQTVWNFAKAKPHSARPDGAIPPVVTFEAIAESALSVPFFTYLRTMLRQAVRGCVNTDTLPQGARARFTVRLVGTPPSLRIDHIEGEALGPGVSTSVFACVSAQLTSGKLPLAPKGFTDKQVTMQVEFE